jgi:hypothetical protein
MEEIERLDRKGTERNGEGNHNAWSLYNKTDKQTCRRTKKLNRSEDGAVELRSSVESRKKDHGRETEGRQYGAV